MKYVWSIKKRLIKLRRFPQLFALEDCVFLLDPAESLDLKIMAGKPFEKPQLAFARKVIARLRPSRFIDIGANFGLYTAIFGKYPFIEAVDSFEPVSKTFNKLTGNVYVNRLDSKVTLHKMGLGNETKQTDIYILPGFSALSRVGLDNTENPDAFSQKETIQIGRGDDVLCGSNQTVYIKIDVEGFVLAVLQGMEHYLKNNCGLLQAEVASSDREIPAYLESFGWTPVHVLHGDSFFEKASAH